MSPSQPVPSTFGSLKDRIGRSESRLNAFFVYAGGFITGFVVIVGSIAGSGFYTLYTSRDEISAFSATMELCLHEGAAGGDRVADG